MHWLDEYIYEQMEKGRELILLFSTETAALVVICGQPRFLWKVGDDGIGQSATMCEMAEPARLELLEYMNYGHK
jgi:hypothetical protein